MQPVSKFDLDDFRKGLYDQAAAIVVNSGNEEHDDELNEATTLDLSNLLYDVSYVSAINRPLEELAELYEEQGRHFPLYDLLQLQTMLGKDISKLRAILTLELEKLVENGLSFDKAAEFICDFHAKNVC